MMAGWRGESKFQNSFFYFEKFNPVFKFIVTIDFEGELG